MSYFERALNIHSLLVVSVAVLIVNIPKSSAVTLDISDKTPHTNMGRFYRYKVSARDVLSTI